MTVTVQHFLESNGRRLRLYDEDGSLLPASADRLDEAPRRKSLILGLSNTTVHLPEQPPNARPKKSRSGSFWRNLRRALGGADKVRDYVSRAVAQVS